jgi:MoxR-like ATPase
METTPYRILDQHRVGSSWSGDAIGKRYHFPKKYLKLLDSPGIRFIYHEPKRKGKWEFYGCGEIGKVSPDPENDGQYFAEIIGYRPFLTPVPAADKMGSRREAGPFFNQQNAVRRVSPKVFDAICAEGGITPDASAPVVGSTKSPLAAEFTKADALAGLFMSSDKLDSILARLKRKKALILQGPPGVGKTFIAKRLAFAFMGQKDERRVAMVQFHPSYGYEDFVQGFRPTRSGLERCDGVFHEFVGHVRNDPGRDWFFIIDEINRGNLAKIFGELLMLIEADKRGPDHAIPLTYSERLDEKFYLPPNIYFIGTMNTADRSLAMVDYALRRRFAFETLHPAIDSPEFEAWLLNKGASQALVDKVKTRVGSLNSKIDKERDLGERFRIGHSFFCPGPNDKPDESWYVEIINSEIKPLLDEYFDSSERVKSLVNELLK